MEIKYIPAPWEVSNKVKKYGLPLIEIRSNHIENGLSFSVLGAIAFVLGHHDEAEETAAHIVKCVNAHDELVKALKETLEDAKEWQTYCSDQVYSFEGNEKQMLISIKNYVDRRIKNAETTLKKVTDTPIEKQTK